MSWSSCNCHADRDVRLRQEEANAPECAGPPAAGPRAGARRPGGGRASRGGSGHPRRRETEADKQHDRPTDRWFCRAVIETNFFGALDTTRAVIPLMRRMGSGRIAFVSSNAVNAPHPTMTMYAASKWAIEGFAEALAMELAPFGVDVVVLQPGNHRTPFGSHVKSLRPADSPYAPIWDALMPGLTELAAIGAAGRRRAGVPRFAGRSAAVLSAADRR